VERGRGLKSGEGKGEGKGKGKEGRGVCVVMRSPSMHNRSNELTSLHA
jgi:hypothetical protein